MLRMFRSLVAVTTLALGLLSAPRVASAQEQGPGAAPGRPAAAEEAVPAQEQAPGAEAPGRPAAAEEQVPGAAAGEASGAEVPGPGQEDGEEWKSEDHGLIGGDRPWARGVSRARQRAAARLFFKANKQLGEQFFKQAAETYREALKHWDHPAIHYNLSLALVNLEQPVELYIALTKSLEHGVVPLVTQANVERAQKYLNLIGQQIAHIEVVCKQHGAKVTLDGKLLFVSPGQFRGPVLVGEHTVTAAKEGYISDSKQVVLGSGKNRRLELKLLSLTDLTYEKRQFPVWLPWAVVATGVAAAGAGGGLHWKARGDLADYDAAFALSCAEGCAETDKKAQNELRAGAEGRQTLAIGLYAAGGTALAAGLVMAFINQPVVVQRQIPGAEGHAALAPLLGPGIAGIRAAVRF